jgi:hypothetical protein
MRPSPNRLVGRRRPAEILRERELGFTLLRKREAGFTFGNPKPTGWSVGPGGYLGAKRWPASSRRH